MFFSLHRFVSSRQFVVQCFGKIVEGMLSRPQTRPVEEWDGPVEVNPVNTYTHTYTYTHILEPTPVSLQVLKQVDRDMDGFSRLLLSLVRMSVTRLMKWV